MTIGLGGLLEVEGKPLLLKAASSSDTGPRGFKLDLLLSLLLRGLAFMVHKGAMQLPREGISQ